MDVVDEILELARWAPSGDNTQPWRFEAVSPTHVVVHAFDTRRHCVYDFEGRASQVSVGAMLETMRIAASTQGCELRITRRPDTSDERPLIDVHIERSSRQVADPLSGFIRERSVQRKALSTAPIDADSKDQLADSVAPEFQVVWFEGFRQRLRMAWLAARSAKIRLTIPEAYEVHRDIIRWDCRYSADGVPDQALGADPMTVRLMRWTLGSWPRVRMMNRYLGGTLAPRLLLDFIPGLRCGAHFAIIASAPPGTIDAYMAAGAAVQRFWLTATSLGLQLQPQYTPLVFAEFARHEIRFSQVAAALRRAAWVAESLRALLGESVAPRAVFLGRVGQGAPATSRSLRRPLEELKAPLTDLV